MKERIVIEKTKECRPHPALREGVNCIDTKYCQFEQVPETFEELKELCKKYNGKGLFIANCYIEVGGVLVFSNMVFTNEGIIYLNTDCCFKEKASPQQMWNIIKSLIGEE